MKELLLQKIHSRQIKVGVIGLGYVGLPLAVEKAKAGEPELTFSKKVAMVTPTITCDVVDETSELAEPYAVTRDFSFVRIWILLRFVPSPLTNTNNGSNCVKN